MLNHFREVAYVYFATTNIFNLHDLESIYSYIPVKFVFTYIKFTLNRTVQ